MFEIECESCKTWARSGPTDAALLVSPDDLRSDFAGFEVLECREVRRTLNEGSFFGEIAMLISELQYAIV